MGIPEKRRTLIGLVLVLVMIGLGLCTGMADDSSSSAPLLRRRQKSASAVGEDHDIHPKWVNNPYWEIVPQPTEGAFSNSAIRDSDASYNMATTASDFKDDDKNNSNHLEDSERAFSTNSAAETSFVQECLGLLETHASDDGRVSQQDYVHFLLEISKGTLKAQTFQDLPLFLSMIFFSASCSHGENCITRAPALTIHRNLDKGEQDMNAVMCQQLRRFPFLEILFPFQFLIRVSSEFSAEDLLVKTAGNAKLVPNLESALDTALLDGFNCSSTSSRNPPIAPTQKTKARGKRQHIEDSARRQPQPQDDCNYVVDVTIADAADYRKYTGLRCRLYFQNCHW